MSAAVTDEACRAAQLRAKPPLLGKTVEDSFSFSVYSGGAAIFFLIEEVTGFLTLHDVHFYFQSVFDDDDLGIIDSVKQAFGLPEPLFFPHRNVIAFKDGAGRKYFRKTAQNILFCFFHCKGKELTGKHVSEFVANKSGHAVRLGKNGTVVVRVPHAFSEFFSGVNTSEVKIPVNIFVFRTGYYPYKYLGKEIDKPLAEEIASIGINRSKCTVASFPFDAGGLVCIDPAVAVSDAYIFIFFKDNRIHRKNKKYWRRFFKFPIDLILHRYINNVAQSEISQAI